MEGHVALHPLDVAAALRVLPDQRPDAVLAEADVTALVGDRAREGVRELRIHLLVEGMHHLEDAERHPLEDDVLPDDAGDEVLAIDATGNYDVNLPVQVVVPFDHQGVHRVIVTSVDAEELVPLGLAHRDGGEHSLGGDLRVTADPQGRGVEWVGQLFEVAG